LLCSQDVEGSGERVGGLLVLVAFGVHVVELAAQFRVLFAQRGLAGGDLLCSEPVLDVGCGAVLCLPSAAG
jgi:hypothetical protein